MSKGTRTATASSLEKTRNIYIYREIEIGCENERTATAAVFEVCLAQLVLIDVVVPWSSEVNCHHHHSPLAPPSTRTSQADARQRMEKQKRKERKKQKFLCIECGNEEPHTRRVRLSCSCRRIECSPVSPRTQTHRRKWWTEGDKQENSYGSHIRCARVHKRTRDRPTDRPTDVVNQRNMAWKWFSLEN